MLADEVNLVRSGLVQLIWRSHGQLRHEDAQGDLPARGQVGHGMHQEQARANLNLEALVPEAPKVGATIDQLA
jgi:hypothetical protein